MGKVGSIETVVITTTVEALVTDTVGDHRYLVAEKLQYPKYAHRNYQIICADNEDEAVRRYNSRNSCVFSSGEVIKEVQ